MADVLLRDLDPVLLQNIKLAAKQRGVSVNRLVAETLAEYFAGDRMPRFDDLDALAGTWSAADLREFERAIEPLNQVDDRLWEPRRK